MQRRPRLAGRSLLALLVCFPVAIAAAYLAAEAFRSTGTAPDGFAVGDQLLGSVIANPDAFTVFVAFCAGVAGMLSLTSHKSAVLIGVLVSVTTIPSAANVAVAAAYDGWSSSAGSLAQLGINLGVIVLAGRLTLAVQRAVFAVRRRRQARVGWVTLGESPHERPHGAYHNDSDIGCFWDAALQCFRDGRKCRRRRPAAPVEPAAGTRARGLWRAPSPAARSLVDHRARRAVTPSRAGAGPALLRTLCVGRPGAG